MEDRRNNLGMNKVEFEVEASRITWTESSPSVLVGNALAADNSRVFKRLQGRWGHKFFSEWKGVKECGIYSDYTSIRGGVWAELCTRKEGYEREYEVGKKLAEGGQAELFELHWFVTKEGYREDRMGPSVIKMFKEGFSLQEQQSLLPLGMLGAESTRKSGSFHVDYCNDIIGAMMCNGRFALLMDRKWGDLRKLIDARMIDNHMVSPPFTETDTLDCMREIVKGMKSLHIKNITHGDLKAANVLVKGYLGQAVDLFDPINCMFLCEVADFECSVGVVGSGFWRAPEILHAVKNQSFTPELITQASDVYSFGMTCYEILTGRIPFELEGFEANLYNIVIGGYRPPLPRKVKSWTRTLVERCWHTNPSWRPTFEEINKEIQKHHH